MTNEIRFTAPLGAIGRRVERMALARYMRTLIVQRNHFLKAAAEASSAAPRSADPRFLGESRLEQIALRFATDVRVTPMAGRCDVFVLFR